MKRFSTVFATLVLGATLFSTAMAQGKPTATPGAHKKHVAMKKVHHHHKLMAKKAAHKVAVHKVVIRKASDKAKPTSKSKSRKPMAQVSRVRTTHTSSSVKAGGKRSAPINRMSIRPLHRTQPLNNGAIKSKSASKAGKVVNRR